MAFNTAITGLKASTIELDVTGNNIANTSTVGFKSGRTEFADIFTTVVVGAGSTNNPGAGVIVSDIAQDFTAGTIEFTNNNLDLAIDGSGFFQLNDGQGGITYTRAGGFELDKDGNVISKTGKFLQGYGLDDAGNQLPIGNLAVDQKESAPQATSEVDLSFNVDSREDAGDLIRPYDPDNSGTFTFSTTTRTFDSLGNEHTLKIDMVEQPPVRERQTLTLGSTTSPFADQVGETVSIAGADLTITGSAFQLVGGAATKTGYSTDDLSFDVVISGHGSDNGTYPVVLDGDYADLDAVAQEIENDINNGLTDPVISVTHNGTGFVFTSANPGAGNIQLSGFSSTGGGASSDIGISADPTLGTAGGSVVDTAAKLAADIAVTNHDENLALLRNEDPRIDDISLSDDGKLVITYKASAANVEDVVTDFPDVITSVSIDSEDLSASEVQQLVFDTDPGTGGSITLGAGTNTYTLEYDANMNRADIINKFVTNQASIVAAIPEIDSISEDPNNTNTLLITYKSDEGNLDALRVSETGDSTLNGTIHGTDAAGAIGAAETVENGDNSYEGVYQMYAYLNGDELLDIGKATPPGAAEGTEPGPVLVTFDSTNGVLQSVNKIPVSGGGLATPLTISGADPADPENDIELDLTGTTQFASESIVKAATQDGFTKGDLIGVAFAEDGTMVASFSNGQNTSLGVVALATFENQGGLQPTGDTEWSATLDSGQAILNPPGTGLNGALRSSALEQSNVDLSEELVALIEAQRNFQANSKTLETENAVTQTILQIS